MGRRCSESALCCESLLGAAVRLPGSPTRGADTARAEARWGASDGTAVGSGLGRWMPRVGRLWAPTGALVVSSETPVAPDWSAGNLRQDDRWSREEGAGWPRAEAVVSGRELVVALASEPRPGRPGGQPASSRVRAVATRSSQPRHPDAAPAGSAHGSLDRTNRTPGRASHRSSTRTSSGLAPRSGPRAG